MNTKIYIKGQIKKEGDKTYKFLASTSSVDRQGDSIDQSGWELDNFKTNPVGLWAHRYDELPVAKVVNIEVTKLGLEADFVFASHGKAQDVKKLVDDGVLNAVSVGFIPKERNGNIITRAELLEISIVPVPANQEAILLSKEISDLIKKDVEDVLATEEIETPVEDLNIENNVVETPKEEEAPEIVEEIEEVKDEEIDEIIENAEIETKAGKVISAKTRKILESALNSFKTSVSEIEKLLALEVATPDEVDDTKSKYVVISRDTIEEMQWSIRGENKRNEKLLSALKQLGN